uniref:Uncharacterized protein n=1 Tax=Arundo donax TaxID=35708 RepID=A0A0A9CC53_ARUDO
MFVLIDELTIKTLGLGNAAKDYRQNIAIRYIALTSFDF